SRQECPLPKRENKRDSAQLRLSRSSVDISFNAGFRHLGAWQTGILARVLGETMRQGHEGASSGEFQRRHLQNRRNGLYSTLHSEFCNYAVGPWASVAGRETALARGNPAIRKGEG